MSEEPKGIADDASGVARNGDRNLDADPDQVQPKVRRWRRPSDKTRILVALAIAGGLVGVSTLIASRDHPIASTDTATVRDSCADRSGDVEFIDQPGAGAAPGISENIAATRDRLDLVGAMVVDSPVRTTVTVTADGSLDLDALPAFDMFGEGIAFVIEGWEVAGVQIELRNFGGTGWYAYAVYDLSPDGRANGIAVTVNGDSLTATLPSFRDQSYGPIEKLRVRSYWLSNSLPPDSHIASDTCLG